MASHTISADVKYHERKERAYGLGRKTETELLDYILHHCIVW